VTVGVAVSSGARVDIDVAVGGGGDEVDAGVAVGAIGFGVDVQDVAPLGIVMVLLWRFNSWPVGSNRKHTRAGNG
jgi:hypothetical protein